MDITLINSHEIAPTTFPDLFETQVTRNPQAIALAFGSSLQSYAQINESANRLAHSLIQSGIGPEQIVAVSLPRSPELVIAVLAILKAGAAYLPLDPEYPADRLAYMLSDAQPALVITTSAIGAKLPGVSSRLHLDDVQISVTLAAMPTSNPGDNERTLPLSLQHPAYIIYTSGSTGRPKGVVVSHSGIHSLVASQIERFAITPDSRVLQFASISFDAAFSELCLGLLSGARLVLAPANRLLPGEPLVALVAEAGVTHITLPPSTLPEMAADSLPTCTTLIVAGEACPPHLVERWAEGRLMINAYGPTETTVCATMSEALHGAIVPSLGKAITNAQVYVLDDSLQEVAVDVAGELYVAGRGLARGYLGRPDLTAERFMPNPFGLPGSRMYRTGDLACRHADGELHFLGRVDHQVKIRGFRIELGEIEAVLSAHPDVHQASVIARADHRGQQHLVGYVVAVAGANADTSALREHVANLLPDYMVPSALLLLDALPLTPNGKLDRDALPAPDFNAGGTAPRTSEETQIAELFAEVLDIEQFGIDDSFFDLGGHSLSATRLISRIRKVFGLKLELDDMFDTPTVAGLAARLGNTTASNTGAETSPATIEKTARDKALPLSFSQQRLWFLDQLQPGNPFYNMPGEVRLSGKLNVGILRLALNEIVRRHESLRTSFAVIDDTPRQVIADKLDIDLPLIDLSDLPHAEREAKASWLAQDEKQTAFDLTTAPLIRAKLLRLEAEKHKLLITVQHTVADGWSMGLLVNEIAILYRAFVRDLPSPLAELPIQYADYSHWQRQWLSGDTLQKQLDYWKQKLAGAPALLALPTDKPRPPVLSLRGSAHISIFLPATSTSSLQALASEHNATLFMALLTVLNATLQRWTGQTDQVIGTVIAGRTNEAIEQLIGCFINFLPLRVQCAPSDSPTQLLKKLSATVREAYTHQDAPFEKITEALNPKRDPSHNPIFNVGFLLQNFPEPALCGDELTAEMLPVTQDTATLDLRFVAQETASGIHFSCEYNTDLFEQGTIFALLKAFQDMLSACSTQRDAPIGELPFPALLQHRKDAEAQTEPAQQIVVASTFTAEPIEDALAFWMKQFDIASVIEFAPYNQVFQSLLDPGSQFAKNKDGVNIILLRAEDWIRYAEEDATREQNFRLVRDNAADFLAATKRAAEHARVPMLVFLCPLSSTLQADSEYRSFFDELQQHLLTELRSINGVYPVEAAELQRLYPVTQCEDAHADELGHIPYSTDMFTAIGTLLARKMVALRTRPYKVIVLDCDNTLWQGVCGEVGPLGIAITPEFQALQRFMLKQFEAGMLLCLSSKNNAEAVEAVFAQNGDMLIKPEHIIGSRINWSRKSQSIKELAKELQLGIDSFIFIDDNPVECAEVEANCPGVLVLQLPEQTAHIPAFLDHVWAFDRLTVTADAQQRTRQYRENQEREAVRSSATSFDDFLISLQLQVTIQPVEAAQLERAAELTQRTNQFNLRPAPRQTVEMQALGSRCLVVDVRDRFGDYGLTGAVIYDMADEVMTVDTFLLSCRILGRGVEHQVIARLGEIALASGCKQIEMPYRETGKNHPILNFLKSIAQNDSNLERPLFSISATQAVTIKPTQVVEESTTEQPAKSNVATAAPILKGALVHQIASELFTAERIAQHVAKSTTRAATVIDKDETPQTATEQTIAEIWSSVLRREAIGRHENFFELGGHSLIAALTVSKIRAAFQQDVPLWVLFEAPTVAALAEKIDNAMAPASGSIDSDGATGNQGQRKRWVQLSQNLFKLDSATDSARNVLLIPGGGNGADVYRSIAQTIAASGVNVFVIHHDGVDNDDEPLSSLQGMVDEYKVQILTHCTGNFVVAGYCMGGTIGYELALQLRNTSFRVCGMSLIDVPLPNDDLIFRATRLVSPGFYENDHMRGFFRAVCGLYSRENRPLTGDDFLNMSMDDCLDRSIKAMQLNSASDAERWRQVIRQRYLAERAHSIAINKYCESHMHRFQANQTSHATLTGGCSLTVLESEEMNDLAPTTPAALTPLGFAEIEITLLEGKHERVLVDHHERVANYLIEHNERHFRVPSEA